MLKIAVFAPMPKPSVSTAIKVKPGYLSSIRAPYRRSCRKLVNHSPPGAPGVIVKGACACRRGAMRSARMLPSLKSASAVRSASSGDAPLAINSRQRSSRCCESSSTISASRVGERRRPDKRGRTCCVQSGMFVSCDELNGVYERRPGLALLSQHEPPLRRDVVEAAASLFRLFDPGPLDPSTLLEPIQQWIERIEVKRDLAAGARVDQFTQLIAVAWSRVEQ